MNLLRIIRDAIRRCFQHMVRSASHKCKYEWTVCQDCLGSGKDQYGNWCHGCEGKGKRSECATCYMEMQWRHAKWREEEYKREREHS